MIVFDNEGVLDLRKAIGTFGLSVKEGESPIGYFGTGLKYAAAVLARHGIRMEAVIDGERHTFGTVETEFRGRDFVTVTLGGEELPFTTELGKNWELWMAFRELYCNALDEGGGVYHTRTRPETAPGRTLFIVHGAEFEALYHDRGRIVLQSEPLHRYTHCEIHPGESQYVYYRGVRTNTLSKPSAFTYNVLSECTLTEDRTLKYGFEWSWPVRDVLVTCRDRGLLARALSVGDGYHEHGVQFQECVAKEVSVEFLGVVAENYHDHSGQHNLQARALYRQLVRGAVPDLMRVELGLMDRKRLERAVRICRDMGLRAEVEVVVVDTLGEGILGMVSGGQIVLARQVFDKGTKMVASTLFEELVRLELRLSDCSRSMQNYLVDKVMSMYELCSGEAL